MATNPVDQNPELKLPLFTKRQKIVKWFQYFLIFLAAVPIWTLLHECGHWIVAVANGHEARIAYAYTILTYNPGGEIYFYFILGGIVASWIESLVPFSILVYRYKKKVPTLSTGKLSHGVIILVTCTSICVRFIFNAVIYVFFPSRSLDEYKLAISLGVWPEILIYGFAALALIIFLYMLSLVPRRNRYLLLLGGILGGLAGYFLWNYGIGPIILPI